MSPEAILRLAAIDENQNLFSIDLDQARQRLLHNPWISRVELTRRLPNTLRVDLEEREARALATIGGELYLVTETGELFKRLEDGDPYDLPLISGLTPAQVQRDPTIATDRLALGLRIIRAYEATRPSRVHLVQEIHLGEDGEAVLTVGKQGTVMHLGRDSWRKKVLMAERVLAQLSRKGQTPGIVFLDNSAHPERVVVRMR